MPFQIDTFTRSPLCIVCYLAGGRVRAFSRVARFRAGQELTQGQRIEISAIALAYLRPLFQASRSPERIRRSLIWERLFESGGTAR